MKPANFQPDFGDLLAGATGVIASMFTQRDSWKAPVRIASTGALTLATDVTAGATIDGVVLVEGDRILLKNQAAASANGIYLASASGAPGRAQDFDESAEILGSLIAVLEGTVNAGTLWHDTNATAIVVGTDAITFAAFPDPTSAANAAMVPYYIAPGDTFTVPLYKQALFETAIDVEGTLTVDGMLIGVT